MKTFKNVYCAIIALLTTFSAAGQSTSKEKPKFQFPAPAFGKVVHWENTLTLAKQQNKWVLIDCYTDWCYWCKVMDQKNFSDTQVKQKMNGFLNCYSLEMEKDSIGKLLRYHYGVNGFPAFLIFNGDGKFIGSYYDTRANLLYKLGRLNEAQNDANTALNLGKVKGDNTAETNVLLSKIKIELLETKENFKIQIVEASSRLGGRIQTSLGKLDTPLELRRLGFQTRIKIYGTYWRNWDLRNFRSILQGNPYSKPT